MNKCIFTLVFCLLISQTSFAATQISGQIRSNTTWTKAASPYVITGLLEIAPGVKLTLEPGTIVEIDLEIHCYGIIEANGTLTDSIYFKSNYKSNKQWRFIRVRDTKPTDTFVFNYCHFDYGGEIYGVGQETYIITNSYLATQASICNFQNAVKLYMENCYLYRTHLYMVGTTARVYNNTFEQGGMNTRATPYLSVAGNKFKGAAKAMVCDGEYNFPMVLDIRNNVFENTIYTALTVNGFGVATFDTVNHFSGNIFTNNLGTAVSIIYMKGKMTGNSIYNNRIGLKVKSWMGSTALEVEGNCFYDNDSLNYVNETEHSYQIGVNWWGTTDSNSIDSSIFDFGEDFKYGKVSFHPYLMQQHTDCKALTVTPPPTVISNVATQDNMPHVYPNPFAGTLQIEVGKNVVITEVCVYNVVGKKLVHLTSVNSNKVVVDTHSLPEGMYLYKISCADNSVYSGKVLKL